MAETVVKKSTYFLVWATLMCLTALTAWLSTYDFGQWSGFVALAIASIKVLLVVFFFMHMRYEKVKMTWIVAIAGIFWMLLLFTGNMVDYLTRQWIGTPGR